MTPTEIIPRAEVVKATREMMATTGPVVTTATSLIVRDSDSYAVADGLLKQIRAARKTVDARLGTIINPIRSGLDSLYTLRTELDTPLKNAEDQVKGKMKAFQILEDERLREGLKLRALEIEKAKQEAAKLEEKAAKATRPSVKTVLEGKADAAVERVLEAQAVTVAPAPKGTSSSVRKIRRPVIKNLSELVRAAVDGQVPIDIIDINMQAVRAYFRDSPDIVTQWPGVDIIEEVLIVGR